MKKLTSANYKKSLEKNRTLVKCTDDPTVVYVFSGHPHDSYVGREDDRQILLYSLTSNDYRTVHFYQLDEKDQKFFIVDKEEDVMGDLEEAEQKTYKKFLSRIEKVFG